MYKSGLLPAPVIAPLHYQGLFGTKIRVGPNTYIQIKADVAGTSIYFTTDGTKPAPFQTGRTGKASTHKYIGPFRLQLGNRVVRAICVSRDKLRESPTTTKYIDVVAEKENRNNVYYSDNENNYSRSLSDNDDDAEYGTEFMDRFKYRVKRKSLDDDYAEVQGSLESGPMNPVNYSGTQINVWGVAPPDLTGFLDQRAKPPQPELGFLTDQMIRNLNTPRAAPIAIESKPMANDFANLPETLRKFFKQLKQLYERDSDFQNGLDYLIENGQVKTAEVLERNDAFLVNVSCPKFLVDEPAPKPKPKPKPVVKPKPRPVSPPVEVEVYKPPIKREPSPPPPPPPPPPPRKVSPPPKIDPPKPASKKEHPPLPSTYVEENIQKGTVVEAPNFNADRDAESLRKSVKGMGTAESIIINIMGNRSNAQRLKIKDMYKLLHGRDLIDDLKGDTSGNFKKLLQALLVSPVEYDCIELRKAVQGLGTDDSVLVEILTSRSNKRMKDIKDLYGQLYKRKLEDDVQSDTSGHYKKLLASLMTGGRPETNEVDLNVVRKDVDELIKAGIKKWGTDEAKFHIIFGIRSFAHLRQLFEEYQKQTKKTMEDSIKSEMSGNLAKTYLALINNIRGRPAYFAREVKKALKGLGTDEHTLNRIIVSRCEIDTVQIKEEYVKLFQTTMEKDIQGDVSGDYGKLLLLLIKDPSERTYESPDGMPEEPEEPHVIEMVEEPKIEETPTLADYQSFQPNDDCEKLRKAMKGLGTDEKTIIAVLAKRSNKQRQQLKQTFAQMFQRDLLKDLDSEISGDFRDCVRALMMTPDEFDAFSFKNAIKGLGTDESALVELLTTRSAEQIIAAKAKYQQLYNKTLESEIIGDTSGDFKHVLVSMLTALRPTGNMVDRTQAKKDAQDLINAGTKKWGTDESKFVTILCSRSFPQLRAMFDEYQKITGKSTFEEDLKKECSGDLLKILSAIVSCVKDRQAYFATLLYKCMKGLGTKESVLTRVIVSRCEVDMVQIKQKFQTLYSTKFADFMKGDVSGDYARILFTLIDEDSYVKK